MDKKLFIKAQECIRDTCKIKLKDTDKLLKKVKEHAETSSKISWAEEQTKEDEEREQKEG